MRLENFSEEEINEAQKQLDNFGIISHFAGEFSLVGALLYGLITLPFNNTKPEVFCYSLSSYALFQIVAFQLRGIGCSREDNIDAINHYSELLCKKEKISGHKISYWFNKKFIELHQGFLKNQEKYERIFGLYMKLMSNKK